MNKLVTFPFQHFADVSDVYQIVYQTQYDSQIISDMEYCKAWFEDLLPEQRMDMFYPTMPVLKTLDMRGL